MAKKAGKLARRYANALLAVARPELALSSGELTKLNDFSAKLKQLADLFSSNKELQAALLSPMFSRGERQQALQAICKHLALPELANKAMNLLFERDRLAYLPEIVDAFVEVAQREANVIHVEVTTAQSLDQNETREVEQSLQKLIKGTPFFQWKVEPEIIGGMIVRYAGKVIDGSVAGRLTRLESELLR